MIRAGSSLDRIRTSRRLGLLGLDAGGTLIDYRVLVDISKLGNTVNSLVSIIQILVTGMAELLVPKHLLGLDAKGVNRSRVNNVLAEGDFLQFLFQLTVRYGSKLLFKLSKRRLLVTYNRLDMFNSTLASKHWIIGNGNGT